MLRHAHFKTLITISIDEVQGDIVTVAYLESGSDRVSILASHGQVSTPRWHASNAKCLTLGGSQQ